jgi:predicted metal-dependent phosphoesterase TrpH
MIDLHTHTRASDGVLSVEDLIAEAEKAGLNALAITDHDTVKAAKIIKDINTSMEVIPGIEISVYDNRLDYIDLHVLGLFIDPENPKLLSTLERLEKEREDQKKAIVSRLNELDYAITYGEVKKKAKGSVGRPHIAMALMEKYPEQFHSISEVFEKLLDQGKPAFRSRTAFFCLDDAIELIHEAGGLAMLAHPAVYKYNLEKLLDDFKRLGGDGIETVYDYARNYGKKGYKEEDNKRISKELHQLAEKVGFLESGGSDFHGPNKGARLGHLDVPDEFLYRLKTALKQSRK